MTISSGRARFASKTALSGETALIDAMPCRRATCSCSAARAGFWRHLKCRSRILNFLSPSRKSMFSARALHCAQIRVCEPSLLPLPPPLLPPPLPRRCMSTETARMRQRVSGPLPVLMRGACRTLKSMPSNELTLIVVVSFVGSFFCALMSSRKRTQHR